MPAYDGNPIFGRAVRMKTVTNPTQDQMNQFFGLNGVQSLFGGLRGRVTMVQGVLYEADAASLNAAIGEIESYRDGLARVLTDSFGNDWPQVKLEMFDPESPIKLASTGYYFVTYKATFQHLF